MANEFVARNGLIAQNNSAITGSLTQGVAGNIASGSYSHAEGGNGVSIDPSQPPISLNDINYITLTGTYGLFVNKVLGDNVIPTAIFLDGDQTSTVPATPFSMYPLSISTDEGEVYYFTVNPQYYDTVPFITSKGYDVDNNQTTFTISPPLQSIYYAVTSDDRNKALGNSSHAEGLGTISSGSYQHVQGQYNKTSTVQSAFIHGNGTSGAARSNLIYAHDSIVEITGSLNVSGSITGSLFGTASYATTASFVLQSVSSSYATSASYAISASQAVSSSYSISASYAISASQAVNSLTASYINPLRQDVQLTGSLSISGSTIQVGNNTLLGNTLLSGSTTVTGSINVSGGQVNVNGVNILDTALAYSIALG